MRTGLTTSVAIFALALSACGETASSEEGSGSEAIGLIGGENADSSGPRPINFGTNESEWANDGECDDPRFEGAAMADVLNTDYIGQDAADCESAFEAGTIALNPYYEEPASLDAINYGDDEGMYPNDGECDDIRFTGSYAVNLVFLPENIGHDASDCRAAVSSGDARWQGATATPEYGVTLEEMEAEGSGSF